MIGVTGQESESAEQSLKASSFVFPSPKQKQKTEMMQVYKEKSDSDITKT